MNERAVATDAEREASRWLVRLESPDVSLDDHRRFRAWLGASEANRAAYAAVSGTWDKLDALTELKPASAARPARRDLLFWTAGAAAAAAVATIAIVPRFGVDRWQIHETGIGERRTITLADGSTAELNADSRIRVRYSDDARRIILERGEALFDVRADAARPFAVETTFGAVRVRGTSFIVRVTQAEMRTTVIGGIVEGLPRRGAADDTPLTIGANQELHITTDAARRLDLAQQTVERRLAWRDGMLAFDGETLREAVAEVERQTGVHFTFADPTLGDLRIGGYISATDADAFIRLLESNVGIRTRRTSPNNILLSR
jgi:transmembrane sensor